MGEKLPRINKRAARLLGTPEYSCIPITRAGSIKRAGRIFLQILINEQVLIRASRLEKIKILAVKLQSGRNFHDIFKNEQALFRASRRENDQKFLVRACSRNRDTRVCDVDVSGPFFSQRYKNQNLLPKLEITQFSDNIIGIEVDHVLF